MTPEEINTLENRVFRLECEQMKWRQFRDKIESLIQMYDTFGFNTDAEWQELKQELESIKYY